MAQLFTSRHYDAFRPPKPDIDGPNSPERAERQRVQDQFLWLDGQLAPYIASHPDWDLHRHHQSQHYTSSTHFIWINTGTGEVDDREGDTGHWTPIVNKIGWLWLHYGKNKPQLNLYGGSGVGRGIRDYSPGQSATANYNAFYVHTRIQFHLNYEHFGVWLLFTDTNLYDRRWFIDRLRDAAFEQEYWNRLQPLLGRGFAYVIDDEEHPLDRKVDRAGLFTFIRSDRGDYAGVRKIYQQDDHMLDIEHIVSEMQRNLDLLYPLYDMMAYRPGSATALSTFTPGSAVNLSGLFGGNVRIKNKKGAA